MLDLSMGEIGLIAAVALVVLGPDKLPQVAKTAGTLMGKAQRFVSQVKNDIDKEVELSELKKIQEDARKMAADLQSNLKNTTDQIEKQVKDVSDSVTNAGQEIKSQMDSASKDIKDSWMASTAPQPELSMENIVGSGTPEASSASTVSTAESTPVSDADWDNLPEKIDTSCLEKAYDWAGEDLPASPAVSSAASEPIEIPEELRGAAPTPLDFGSAAASKVEVSADILADLKRELEALKQQVAVQQHAVFSQVRPRGGSRLTSNAHVSKPRRQTAVQQQAAFSQDSRKGNTSFTPNSHVNKTRISRISS